MPNARVIDQDKALYIALAGIIPTVVCLIVFLYSGEIMGVANLQLVAFNSNIEPFLPTFWNITSAIIAIALLVNISNTVIRFIQLDASCFNSPNKLVFFAKSVASILFFMSLILQLWFVYQLIIYFLNNLN